MSRLEEKEKKAKRLHKDNSVMNNRMKFAKANGMNVKSKNRLNKRHPMDCGKANCGLCSSPRKLWKEKTMQEKRHEQKGKFDE